MSRPGSRAWARAAAGGVWLLGLAGCAGLLTTRRAVVERDVVAHLHARYGEPFVLTRLTNESSAGLGVVDRFRFEAHPVADTSLGFRGGADYGGDAPVVFDTYACARVQRWLPREFAARLDGPLRVESLAVYCGDGLPPAPAPGAPLPLGEVTTHLVVWTFADGDVDAALAGARASVERTAASLGVVAKGELWSYPAGLSPYAALLDRDTRHPDDWDALVRGWDRIPERGAPEPRVRAADLEAEVATLIHARHPGARVSVRAARPADGRGRAEIDVRVAAPDLALGPARDTALALAERLPPPWTLRAMDRASPADPARAARVCRGKEPRGSWCEDAAGAWLDPAVVHDVVP